MAGETERINVILPKELAEELRTMVPARQRSQVIAQALAEKLKRLRQTEAIRQAAGAWRDEDHPDLMAYEDYEVWKQRIRGGLNDRLRRLGPEAGSEEDVSAR